MDKRKFDLEHQYQLYLERVGLIEDKMHPVQRKETRQAFMGACGQLLMLLRKDWQYLDNKTAADTFQDMSDQVRAFFLKSMYSEN